MLKAMSLIHAKPSAPRASHNLPYRSSTSATEKIQDRECGRDCDAGEL